MLFQLLAAEYVGYLDGYREYPLPARDQRSIHAHSGPSVAMVDYGQSGRPGTGLVCTEQVPDYRQLPSFLYSFAHGNGRLLGDGCSEHSRLHTLRQVAEGADARPGA